MAKLSLELRKRWVKDLRWRQEHPGERRPTLDPLIMDINRYVCNLCEEKKWYYMVGFDKDMPQYHKQGKRWLTICHACWHLKNIFVKHQKETSFEGRAGCRICHLQLAQKRTLRQRDKGLRKEASTSNKERRTEIEPGPTNWEPSRVRGGDGVPERRKRGADVPNARPGRRSSGEMPNSRLRKRMVTAGR